MIYTVGLTGSIGSGKTTVAKYFEELNVPVIYADKIARQLTEPHTSVFSEVITYFGQNYLDNNGQLNRSLLRKRIFEDDKARIFLEKLLHPIIIDTIQKELSSLKAPYAIVEIPLIYQREDFPFLDRILLVTADENIANERVISRDKLSFATLLAMRKIQPEIKCVTLFSDDLIENNASLSILKEKVKKLHEQYQKYEKLN